MNKPPLMSQNAPVTELAWSATNSKTLSAITGAEIWLKFENQQFTAAYKERGALNALLKLTDEQKARGVIAASAGNHSQGLSYHGTRLGVPVTIVMPRTTPTVKVMQTESVGGKVMLEGESGAHLGSWNDQAGNPMADAVGAYFLCDMAHVAGARYCQCLRDRGRRQSGALYA